MSLLLAAERISQTKVFQDPISLCGMAHCTVITTFLKKCLKSLQGVLIQEYSVYRFLSENRSAFSFLREQDIGSCPFH